MPFDLVGKKKWTKETIRKKILFSGVPTETTHTVRVTLVLNGQAIASSQKKLKGVAPPLPPDIQAAQALLAASQMSVRAEL